ncbi:head decoration protein [Glaciimonas sp. GS1]|uniref:Head decoration protein n=2 Tax=Glaciimonas soli TaxID=2590999 RepID=A0A843YT20_9BURK|nr:head decoration protein [Glaciimonas soli]
MQSVTLQEGHHVGEFLLSEGNGTISREEGILTLTGTALVSGTVVAKLDTGKYVAYNAKAKDGAQVASAVLYNSTPAITGDYKAVFIVRNAEVMSIALTGIDAAAVTALQATSIVVR